MPGPLDGIRVVEFTVLQLGPQCGQMLHDLGARVIKVEPRFHGDLARSIHLSPTDPRPPFFMAANRGKRSITLDLQAPPGLEVAKQLIERADVMLCNLRPGAIEKLGLGYEECAAINPRLVYASGSTYGPAGKDAMLPGADPVAQAIGGLVSMTGTPEQPGPAGAIVADSIAGQTLCVGIVAALYSRTQSGRGQRVDASLYGGLIWAQSGELNHELLAGPMRLPRVGGGYPALSSRTWSRVYATSDGAILLQGRTNLPQILAGLECPHLLEDTRFSDDAVRLTNMNAFCAELAKVLRTKTAVEWSQRLAGQKVDHVVVRDYTAIVNDEQALANDYLADVEDPLLGRTRVIGNPLRLSETPTRVAPRAPELGEHTEEVLLELGYDWESISALREAGVI